MVKNINNGEIDKLKEGFKNTVTLKKINMLGGNNFMNKEFNMSLNDAIKIYKTIYKLKVMPDCYKNCSAIMMNYLVKYNLLDENKLKEITKIFYDDSGMKEPDMERDDGDYYSDDGDDRYGYILYMLKQIGSEKGINIHTESYSDIVFGKSEHLNLDIFGDIREALEFGIEDIDEIRNCSEDAFDEAYLNIFEDNAMVYVLEDYEINEYDLIILRNTLSSEDDSVASEIYTKNDNTYIILSNMQIYYGLGYSFLIMLKLILLKDN